MNKPEDNALTAQEIMVDNLEKSMKLLNDSCKKQAINGLVHLSYIEQAAKIIVDGYKKGISS